MENVKQLKDIKLHVKPLEVEVFQTEQPNELIDGPKELKLPKASIQPEHVILSIQPPLDLLKNKSRKQRTQFLKERANVPSFYEMDRQVQEQERLLLNRASCPVLNIIEDHVTSQLKKRHLLSMNPSNPSLDTYLDRDDELSWGDVYGRLPFFLSDSLTSFSHYHQPLRPMVQNLSI